MQDNTNPQLMAVAMEYQRLTGHHPSVGLIEQGHGNFNAFAEFGVEDWNEIQTFDKATLKEAFDKTPLAILNVLYSQKADELKKMRENAYI